MKYAPIPKNENEREGAVLDLKILDTPNEERFDRITKKATQIFNVPVSTISIIDKNREWYKAKEGVKAIEGPRNISFCGHALLQREVLIIEDTLNNPVFADNPYVVSSPGVRFYAGKSLYNRKNNLAVGVFCIKDFKPRKMSVEDIAKFLDLAEEAEDKLNKNNA